MPETATFTEFNVRQNKGKPHFIRLHDSVVRRLERQLSAAGEAHGILLGSVDSGENCTIAVEEFAPATTIEESVRTARRVVGYYRSHSQADFALEESDRDLFARCFPKEARLALLVKPAGTAMFFLGENGQPAADRSTVEFPFNLRELGAEEPAPPPAVAPSPAAKAARSRPFLKIAAACAAVIASVVGLNALGVFERRQSPPAPVETVAPVEQRIEQPVAAAPIAVKKTTPPVVVHAPKKTAPVLEARSAPLERPAARSTAPPIETRAVPPQVSQALPVDVVPAPSTQPRVQNSQPVPARVVVPSPPPVAPVAPPKPLSPYTAPHATRQFAPIVKENVRRSISGEVIVRLRVNVDAAGKVIAAEPLSRGNPVAEALAASAVAAVKRWEFEPARRGDEKVPGDVELSFTFRK